MENESLNQGPVIDNNPTGPVGNDKLYSILAYIGILWLIGLLAAPEKDHAFTKNHVNNGIILCIAGIICGIIPVIGWLCSIVVLVFAIMGIVAAAQDKTYTIPLIGDKFQIVK